MDGEREIFCPRTGADWKAGKSMTIYQLDGNESMEADESEDETGSECPPPWYDPYNREQEQRTRILRRINTNDRVAISAEMPT